MPFDVSSHPFLERYRRLPVQRLAGLISGNLPAGIVTLTCRDVLDVDVAKMLLDRLGDVSDGHAFGSLEVVDLRGRPVVLHGKDVRVHKVADEDVVPELIPTTLDDKRLT